MGHIWNIDIGVNVDFHLGQSFVSFTLGAFREAEQHKEILHGSWVSI